MLITKSTDNLRRLHTLAKFGLAVMTASVMWAGMPGPAGAQERVARMAYHWNPKHHSAIHAQKFADLVNARTTGKLRIDIFPSGQLYGIREIMGAVTAGSVEIGGIVGVVSFPPLNKNYNVIAYSGLFDSYDQQRAFFERSATGKALWGDITDKSNSVLLMYNPVGPVMTFSAQRDLVDIAAMRGLKARALIRVERPLWKALGANVVSLPTGEVYTSLQSGLIDTINSPPVSIKAYSWWEFLEYGQLPYQYFADAYMMANAEWFNRLPDDLQQILRDAGREVSAISTDTVLKNGDQTLAEFKQRGGVITTLQGPARAEFDRLMEEKVLPEIAELLDPEVFHAAVDFTRQ